MLATLILGAGPAGTGPLVWAARNNQLEDWLARGVAIVEQASAVGGTIGRYIVNADSLGTSFLECLDAPAMRSLLSPLRDDAVTRELEEMRNAYPPLTLVGRFLRKLGAQLATIVGDRPGSRFLSGSSVRELRLRADGSVAAEVSTMAGTFEIEARTAIMALGGVQDVEAWLRAELVPGVRLADVEPEKIMPSDVLLTADGLRWASAIIERARTRRIVILGGSHSAFSVAWVLLSLLPEVAFSRDDIAILFRREPRIFYASLEAAQADGYVATENDICPATGRVHRCGGLRGDGRELWRRLTGRGGGEWEDRVRIVPLGASSMPPLQLRRLLDEAALVVPAFGYRAATVPVLDAEGRRLRLVAERGCPSVGRDARLLLTDGRSLPNVFGIGLGTGYRPWGEMGGEPSFEGQQNSLWLYQNDIGRIVHEGIRECLEDRRAAVSALSS